MAITKRRKEEFPLGTLATFKDEIDRLFDDFLAPFWRRPILPRETIWAPELDIAEDENNIVVSADLPGMKSEDIDISISGNTLTIRGERKQEEEKKGRNYYRLERCYGSFARSVDLPSSVDASKVSASYKNGVLEITLPKVEEAKKIKIEVK